MSDDCPQLPAVLAQDVHLVGERVLVRRPTQEDAAALTELLTSDYVLHKAAGMSGKGPSSAAEYLADTARWEQRHNAICLATVWRSMDQAVGTISLSHIDLAARTGGIGYWTASARWRQGLTSEAFGLVLQLARSLELKWVSATIHSGNIASQRIYQRYGGRAVLEQNGRFTYTIVLSSDADWGEGAGIKAMDTRPTG